MIFHGSTRHKLPLLLFLLAVAHRPVVVQSSSLSSAAAQHATPTSQTSSSSCSLYYAESSVQPGRFGLYSGVNRPQKDELVVDPDIFVPIWDANANEYSPWHDYAWGGADGYPPVASESSFLQHLYFPGLTSMMACSSKYANVVAQGMEEIDPAGVHRATDPTAGSFTYYHNSAYLLLKPVVAGEELVVACPPDAATAKSKPKATRSSSSSSGRKVLNLDFLKETSVCVEGTLATKLSSIPGAGRGAFATRSYREGDVVLTSPVIHMDRSQLEIFEQRAYPDHHWTPYRRSHHILYNATSVTASQLLTNYVYGDASSSSVVLLPLAPHAAVVNHGGKTRANVKVRWSEQSPLTGARMKKRRPMELLSAPVGGADADVHELLVLEFVATRTIEKGDEILLDYGDDWETAWRQHVAQYRPAADSIQYRSAAQYLQEDLKQQMEGGSTFVFRTRSEQEETPYPDNLRRTTSPRTATTGAKSSWRGPTSAYPRACDRATLSSAPTVTLNYRTMRTTKTAGTTMDRGTRWSCTTRTTTARPRGRARATTSSPRTGSP
jgi:hypothetical protein